jgi:hypothetical protein
MSQYFICTWTQGYSHIEGGIPARRHLIDDGEAEVELVANTPLKGRVFCNPTSYRKELSCRTV